MSLPGTDNLRLRPVGSRANPYQMRYKRCAQFLSATEKAVDVSSATRQFPRRKRKRYFWRRKRKRLQQLLEFKGIQRQTPSDYRDDVRQLYDGPKGAVLRMSSLISLHTPLLGQLIRRREFDVTRFRDFLDVGSGAGQILSHIVRETSQDGARVVAFDLSLEMLRRARQRMRSRRPRYVSGDLMRLPFRRDSFDCITCGYVLEHIPDPRPGLRELTRVLRPGGSLLLLCTEDTILGTMTSHTWKCRTYSRDELKAACAEAGLEWKDELWFTRIHRLLRLGGILVEAVNPASVH